MSEYQHANAELTCSSPYILPVLKAEIVTLPSNSVIADFGCGNGSVLAQFRGHGFQLHGLDMSRSGLALAKKHYPDINFSYADLTGDFSSHCLVDKCDIVISTEVVEHIFLPRLFAVNCYRVLKPGGRLLISTPYHGYFKNLALALSGKLEAHFTVLWDYGHIKFWSKRTLTLMLEEAGFVVDRFYGTGRVPFLWKSMVLIARKPYGCQ